MALDPQILLSKIREINDESYSGFVAFPVDQPDTASKWGAIVEAYASTITPVIVPGTAQTARAAFESVLVAMSASLQNGLVIFPQAFTAFAAVIAPGMGPAFVGVPPPVPINLTPLVAPGLAGASAFIQAGSFAVLIDTWFRTGTATPSAGGSPVPWS